MFVQGIDVLTDRLSLIPKKTSVNMRKAVNQGALMVQRDAFRAIKKHSAGKLYIRRGKKHIASKAGDAPNTDTGNLIRNIRVSTGRGNVLRGYSAEVKAVTPYALRLEFGQGRVKARPFMGPSLNKNKAKIRKLILNAVKKSL